MFIPFGVSLFIFEVVKQFVNLFELRLPDEMKLLCFPLSFFRKPPQELVLGVFYLPHLPVYVLS